MTTLLATIFVLGLLVFVHELGHFLVAKRAGIKVERFSLGFPPKMIGKKIGETEYCISWLPLGGYVKMAGEEPDAAQVTGAPYEFMSKPIWIRSLVVVAGPVMNYLLAVLLIWGIFFLGGRTEVDENQIVVGTVMPGSPAEKAGIKPGDKIMAVDGQAVKTFDEMREKIYAKVEKPVEVTWLRDGREMRATIVTFKDKSRNEKGQPVAVGRIGIGQAFRLYKVGFFEAARLGVVTSWDMAALVGQFLYRLIIGQESFKSLGGPVFIAQIAGESAHRGFADLLMFAALLSVNLALLNILPIPALDGGHLLFLFIEKLRGKPLSLKQRAVIQQVGFAFLILLIVFATYNDILRIFH